MKFKNKQYDLIKDNCSDIYNNPALTRLARHNDLTKQVMLGTILFEAEKIITLNLTPNDLKKYYLAVNNNC